MKESAVPEITEKAPSAARVGLNQITKISSIDDTFKNEEIIAESGLFDASWYRAQYTNVQDTNLIRHYLTHGTTEGFDPNPLFDTSWYLEQYRDVRDAAINPLVHYIQQGADEGRDPNPHFDTDWFLKRNRDVKKAGMKSAAALFALWRCGRSRSERRLFQSWYREQYMSEADDALNPLDHYMRYGMAAGYEPQPPNADYLLELLKHEQSFVLALPEIQQHIDAMVIRPHFFV